MNVYQVNGLDETAYFNTLKEALRHKPGGDVSESVERLDAAEECNRLEQVARDLENDYYRVRLLLEELCDVTPDNILSKGAGRRALDYIESHPMAAATAGDRDGERGYGV